MPENSMPVPDDELDVTDNDPMDEGLIFLGGCEKHQPNPDDYAYANKVREGKLRKALIWKIITNLSFWLYLIFNFIKEVT